MNPQNPQKVYMQNTRLFPKNDGVGSYRLSGIASRCDWVILSDRGTTEIAIRGNLLQQPQTVFLSLRSGPRAISCFVENVLPRIKGRFVLVTGSEDITIPNQTDVRWRSFTLEEKGRIHDLINDGRLIHWFVENRDQALPKLSTMPVGYVFSDGSQAETILKIPAKRISKRALKVLCAHRIKMGGQWEPRSRVTALCNGKFRRLSTVIEEELPLAEFQHQIRVHPFVLCVQGGGLDPSPKAWATIANGSIPIIKSSPLDDAYSQLPVAFVDDWDEDCLNEAKLQAWMDTLSPYYEVDHLREQTVYRLSLDYWWEKVVRAYDNGIGGISRPYSSPI